MAHVFHVSIFLSSCTLIPFTSHDQFQSLVIGWSDTLYISVHILYERFTSFVNLYTSKDRIALWVIAWDGLGPNGSLIVLEWHEIGSALSIRTSGMPRPGRGRSAGAEKVIGEWRRWMRRQFYEALEVSFTISAVECGEIFFLWRSDLEFISSGECVRRKNFMVSVLQVYMVEFMSVRWVGFTSHGSVTEEKRSEIVNGRMTDGLVRLVYYSYFFTCVCKLPGLFIVYFSEVRKLPDTDWSVFSNSHVSFFFIFLYTWKTEQQ